MQSPQSSGLMIQKNTTAVFQKQKHKYIFGWFSMCVFVSVEIFLLNQVGQKYTLLLHPS